MSLGVSQLSKRELKRSHSRVFFSNAFAFQLELTNALPDFRLGIFRGCDCGG